MRRLPVYLLIDVSESMAGENLRMMQDGLEQLVRTLRTDPYALETAYLCIIGFAGKPRTLTPLVELVQFYPPRLPIGSGTSLGAAMNHLMDDIQQNVQRTTAEAKGDWRPIVFLMTDGKPTDDIEPALARWTKNFASRSSLVGIGVGRHASLATLRRFTETVLSLDATTSTDFKRFIDWISHSVSSQSRSVSASQDKVVSLAKIDDDIMKKIDDIAKAAIVDEDFVILAGKCQTTKLPYLIKYERFAANFNVPGLKNPENYHLAGVYPAEQSYYDLSDERVLAQTISTERLIGSPGCPHCGNRFGLAMCSCGQIMCVSGPGSAVCPTCNRELNMQAGDEDFDVGRARG
ncbi:MAG: VWA domain-containing protein [Azoarcus sp.]|jgi:uncharacterized protein YegL|nr:VWA domain-containing protein [Azoarcus sp.]